MESKLAAGLGISYQTCASAEEVPKAFSLSYLNLCMKKVKHVPTSLQIPFHDCSSSIVGGMSNKADN